MSSDSSQINQELQGNFTDYFSTRKLVYYSREIERGLGLACLFKDNLKVIYRNFDAISDQFNNDSRFIHKTFIGSSSALARTGIYHEQKDVLMFFKYTNQLRDLNIWNNPPKLTRKLENKLFLAKLLENSNLESFLPEQKNKSLKDINLDLDVSRLGNVVVQLPFGHTGNTTFIIDQSKSETENKKIVADLNLIKEKYPKRLVKLSKFVKGIPLTINACATNKGTFIAGLSIQITGIDELSTDSAVTCGNDWTLANHILKDNKVIQNQVIEITEKIGKMINKRYGFLGIFGLDLIFDSENNKVYIIEINPRQVASINYFTILQESKNELSLQLIHLEAFRDKNSKILARVNRSDYNRKNLLGYDGSQISVRGSRNSDSLFGIDHSLIKTGKYEFSESKFKKSTAKVNPLKKPSTNHLNIYNNYWLKSSFDYFAEIIKVQSSSNLVELKSGIKNNKFKLVDLEIEL